MLVKNSSGDIVNIFMSYMSGNIYVTLVNKTVHLLHSYRHAEHAGFIFKSTYAM